MTERQNRETTITMTKIGSGVIFGVMAIFALTYLMLNLQEGPSSLGHTWDVFFFYVLPNELKIAVVMANWATALSAISQRSHR